MNTICRLCFSFADGLTASLHSSDVVTKIRSFSNVEILVKDNLPYKICKPCESLVDQCYEFNLIIQKNEHTLSNLISDSKDALATFFNSLAVTDKLDGSTKLDIESDTIDHLRPSLNASCIKDNHTTDENTVEYISEDDACLLTTKPIAEQNYNLQHKNEKDSNVVQDFNKVVHINVPNGVELNQENREWKCLTCNDSFTSRAILRIHYKTIHGAVNTSKPEDNFNKIVTQNGDGYQCCVCQKEYPKLKNMKRHMMSHDDTRPYDCRLCGRKYKTVMDILRHARAHEGGRTFLCSEGCGFRTGYHTALKNHESRHNTKFKFRCEQCGKGFQVKTWFQQHQNIHTGQKPYVCDDCGKTFHMEKYLRVHQSKAHASTAPRRHFCVHCAFTCATRHALAHHLKEEHGIATSFLCDICGKNVATAEYLKFHRRAHLGEKPYTCSTCSAGFAKKCNLTLHERTHSGAKPYVCPDCQRPFAQKSTMMRHARHHTGVRPYRCTNCLKTFLTKTQLASHRKCR